MNQQGRQTRKTKSGIVVSNKMQNTVVVSIETTMQHPRYGKVITVKKKLYAHDDTNELQVGDKVKVAETRPLSKTKRWRVTEKLEAQSQR